MNKVLTKHARMPVSVWFKYDHVARRLVVKKILWSGREYRVLAEPTQRSCGPSVRRRNGARYERLFLCRSPGGMHFALTQDYLTQQWLCVEARNAWGDVVEP